MRPGKSAIGAAVVVLAITATDVGANISNKSVLLGADKSGNRSWSASISRITGRDGEGMKGRRRPCLSVSGIWPAKGDFQGSTSTLCVASPSLSADSEPLIIEGGEPTPQRGIESKFTVVAIALAPRVAQVQLTNFDGTKTTLDARALTDRQAKRARLARLRYVNFAVAGPYCVDHIANYDADGQLLWDNGTPGRCPPQEFPQPAR
jgi:hypothetical protein